MGDQVCGSRLGRASAGGRRGSATCDSHTSSSLDSDEDSDSRRFDMLATHEWTGSNMKDYIAIYRDIQITGLILIRSCESLN